MSGIPYHGWTHRPKGSGGTDPIPGGGTLPFSVMTRSATKTMTTAIAYTIWDDAANVQTYNTDTSILECDDTNGWIDVNAPGIYLVSMEYSWSTSFAGYKVAGIQWRTSGDYNVDWSYFEFSNQRANGYISCCDYLIMHTLDTDPTYDHIAAQLIQGSGVNRDLSESRFKVVQLSPL